MSKHWRPDRSADARTGRRGLRFSAGELRLMVLGGLLGGIVLAGVPGIVASPPAEAEESWRQAPVPDPWAESRRSRAILEAQEGSPGPRPVGRTAVQAVPAAVRIVDGDTFWYGGEKIRIADIDTPEVRGRCPYESQLAARATARMAALLAAGPFELRPIDRDEDRYGRKLRVVTRGGRSLGDQLVAEGLARTWSGRREPWC